MAKRRTLGPEEEAMKVMDRLEHNAAGNRRNGFRDVILGTEKFGGKGDLVHLSLFFDEFLYLETPLKELFRDASKDKGSNVSNIVTKVR